MLMSYECHSLVISGPSVEHIGLQLGEKALLVFSLTNLHVQQVGVDGRVVDLYQALLDGLSYGGDRRDSETHLVLCVVILNVIHMNVKEITSRQLDSRMFSFLFKGV